MRKNKRRVGVQVIENNGANGGIRTRDLLITNQLLCQLSYIGDFAADFNQFHDLLARN